MNAVVLVGHGSVKSASGAAMIRLAARLQERGIASFAAAGFLNYSRPTLGEAIEKAITQGATHITVQPYFLIDGRYVREDLPSQVRRMGARFPGVVFRVADSLGAHPLLAEIVLERIRAVDPARGQDGNGSALLVIAHGTPHPEANAPVEQIARRIDATTGYCRVEVAYLDCNRPTVLEAMEGLVEAGIRRIVALPYFLQHGRHTREDVPRLLGKATQHHPDVMVRLARHLGYDVRLAAVIADRVVGWRGGGVTRWRGDKVTG